MTRPAGEVVARVENLVKTFGAGAGAATAVGGVSFELARGRTTAMVGESGAGKSTIGAILTGLFDATSGRVEVCGEDRSRAARSGRDRRRRGAQLQLVSQDPYTSLDPSQRIGAALAEALALHGLASRSERPARVAELLASVGLDPAHARCTPSALSGGQRQRVAIARALAPEPEVIVLDEAVSALDVSVQAQILNLLNRLQRERGTAHLFITHDLAVVRQVADDVIVLKDGVIVEHAGTDAIMAGPSHPYTRLLLASTPRAGWVPVARDHGLSEPARAGHPTSTSTN